MTTDKIPPPVSSVERWVVENHAVAVRASYKMTSEDTCDYYITLTSRQGKEVTWLQSTFNGVAKLRLSGDNLIEPNYGLREKVEARDKYEKSNAAELATFKRLKAKFEGAQP